MSDDFDVFEDDDDEDEFDHFVDAQDTVFPAVVAELTAGKKTSHWMWFIFPVLMDIGQSPMAMFYSLRDLDEAKAYAAHPILGPRLEDCMHLILAHDPLDVVAIMGDTDAFKLRACATLFSAAVPTRPVFAAVLDRGFAGQKCNKTLRLLREPSGDDLFG